MATTSALMAAGMPAAWANMLGTTPAPTVTAAGASQQAATQLTPGASILGPAAAAGVVLPPAGGQPDCVVYNNSGNTQNIYPANGETINSLTANTPVTLITGKSGTFMPAGHKAWIYSVSA